MLNDMENHINKIKIVFAGGRQLGCRVLEWMCEQKYLDIVGVCTLSEDFDAKYYKIMSEIIKKNNLKIIDIEQIHSMRIDVGLSVNFNKIIPPDILDVPRIGFFNIHHSYNMMLRGRNITTHAILNSKKEKIYYHGTSLHKMVKELDAGPIVATAACSIDKMDTAYSLFVKVDELAYDLVREWLPRICYQTVFLYNAPLYGIHCYSNKDLPCKEIDIDKMGSEEIYDYVRAFDYPGYEPVFYVCDGKKKHLVTCEREMYTIPTVIKGKKYFSENI